MASDEGVWVVNIVKLLIHHDGNLPAKMINKWAQDHCKSKGIQAPSVYNIIGRNCDKIFSIDDAQIKKSNVSVKTSAELCQKHWSKQGCSENNYCDKIHICKYKITGNCSKPRCSFGHDFESAHNVMILRKHGISFLANDDLFLLFKSRKIGKIPQVCKLYNTGQCKFNEACDSLHLCYDFVLGDCTFGPLCRLSHCFNDTQPQNVLKKLGWGKQSNPKVILKTIRYSLDITPKAVPCSTPTKPKVCVFYNKNTPECRKESLCPAMHICRHYLNGNCRFGQRCNKSHNILDDQPKSILMKHGWDVARSPKAVLQEFQRNNNNEIEDKKTCTYYLSTKPLSVMSPSKVIVQPSRYNEIDMQQIACSDKMPSAHTINPSRARPKEKVNAKRQASASPSKARVQPSRYNEIDMQQIACSDKMPSAHTINPSRAPSRARPKEKVNAKRQASASPSKALVQPSRYGDTEEDNSVKKICTYYLSTKCMFGTKCRNQHYKKPYLWQYTDTYKGETVWMNFNDEDNNSIEISYSRVNEDCSANVHQGVANIMFDEMIYVIHQLKVKGNVRRIGTDSWGDHPLTKPFVTKWLWYWQDEFGKWREYGKQESSSQSTAEFTSRDIEEKYMLDTPEIQFKAGNKSYILSLKNMEQQNQKYGTKRKVRRRPAASGINSRQDMKREEKKNTDSRYQEVTFPKHWNTDVLSTNPGYQLVQVSKICKDGTKNPEYYNIKKLFVSTMKSQRIKKLIRIQNYELWEEYSRKKEKMEKASFDGSILEKRLFHGTREKYIDAISQQGFDWRVTGSSSGTTYGKGSYFARDASYSHKYTKCEKMFVVKVLVGEYARGKSDMVRPPPKNPANPYTNLYDSCVDSKSDPQIYILFEKAQSYPEYIIEY